MIISLAQKNADTVNVQLDGSPLKVRRGLNVAAALLEANVTQFRRTPVTASPRGPFCMMGVCFDCILTIDGLANQQACMIEVCEGMEIERQTGDGGLQTQQDDQNVPLNGSGL